MRPKPFTPEALEGDAAYFRDKTGGLVWHCSRMRPLYADTDRSQVVYHANFLRYFEFGRASLMRDAAYPYKEIEDGGTIYPIIQIGVDYFSPVYYDDPMCIYTRPAVIERVRLRFDYVITHEADPGDRLQGVHAPLRGQRQGGPRGSRPEDGPPMEDLPALTRIVESVQVPLEIPVRPCLMDHRFDGRAVLPAVEAMEVLARAAGRFRPDTAVDAMSGLQFDKFLAIAPDADRLAAFCEFTRYENGDLKAVLATRTTAKKSAVTRVKEHATLVFPRPGPVRPEPVRVFGFCSWKRAASAFQTRGSTRS